jgi:maleate isomerase
VDALTVGILTPHASPGPEVELPAMAQGRVRAVVSRTMSRSGAPSETASSAHAGLIASADPVALDRAAVTFSGWTLAAVAHASTTTGYVLGRHGEAALVDRLSQRFEVPAVTSCAAVATALRRHGVRVVALVHPPWFDDEFDELGAAYFRSHGVDVVVTKAVTLPDDPSLVNAHGVIDSVAPRVEDRTEAIILAGNGFRAAGAVEELELRTGRLVLEANQALLWGILAATGTESDVTGYGRLLRPNRSTT